MILDLSLIVEGHGETEAVPALLRRIRDLLHPGLALEICPPLRIGRNKLLKPGEIERAVELAARRMRSPRAISILIDADDDCPAEVAPELLRRAKAARTDVPMGVVLAKREFEAWFLAALPSLRGRRGLRTELPDISSAESVRDTKGFLTQCMEGSRAYSPVVDQPALAVLFDLDSARRRSDSFDKFFREVQRLLGVAEQTPFETS